MLETIVMEKRIARKDADTAQLPNADTAKGEANAMQRSKGFVSLFNKAPVVDKALPTPTPELGSPMNGIGRKGDINGRVKARLSSLMSPPASSGTGVPDEVEVHRYRTELPIAPPDVPKSDPSGEAGITGTTISAVEQGRPHAEAAGTSDTGEPAVRQDGEEGPVWEKDARPMASPSPVDVGATPHQSIDMTKPVMGPGRGPALET